MHHTPIITTEKRISELYGWAVSTLRNWRHLGKGPPYLKVGRSVRYRLDDVEAFLELHKIETEGNKGK